MKQDRHDDAESAGEVDEEAQPLLKGHTGLAGDSFESVGTSSAFTKEHGRLAIDITSLRTRAAQQPKLEDWNYFERENQPSYMVLLGITAAFVQVTVVLGAYFFVQSSGQNFTPHCRTYHGPDIAKFELEQGKLKAYACYVTTFCFWTYPIMCPLVVIAVFWKNLLDKRLFYECLLNRIFICYSSTPHLASPTFWFLVLYLACGMSCIVYVRVSPAWSMRPLEELIFALLAYLSPIFAFLVVLFSQWSVNWHLVSLPKFVERDHGKAIELLNSCTFVKANDFRIAFRAAESAIRRLRDEDRLKPELNTAELLRLVLDQHERRDRSLSTRWSDMDCSFGCVRCYWVAEVLYFGALKDGRSWRFRFFARLYVLFIVVAIVLFVWAMAFTVQQFIAFQRASVLDLLPSPEKVWNNMKQYRQQ
mmetsp:Transcript_66807/g.150869  ORF Transcript_66807/g.150869 Transcript_66807/m.150869 type:complete len:419 (-) Transcript_66807:69-1325(-)